MIPRARLALTLPIVVGLLAACGSEDNRAGSAPLDTGRVEARQSRPPGVQGNDPCSMIEARRAERLVERPLQRRRTWNGRIETCVHEVEIRPQKTENTFVAVTVVHRTTTREAFLSASRGQPGRSVGVADLGDVAVSNAKTGCIGVLTNGVEFTVCARRDGRPLDTERLRPFARDALRVLSAKS